MIEYRTMTNPHLDITYTIRPEFPAIVGEPGRNYIFADAPTGTQV